MFTKRVLLVILTASVVMLTLGAGTVLALPLPPDEVRLPVQSLSTAGAGGGPIGSRFVIHNDGSKEEMGSAIAYNSQREEYLVVWYNDRPGNDDIQAQLVSRNGTLIGGAFYISAGTGAERRYPDVAYNDQLDEYLVVWEHDAGVGPSIYGRRVSATGLVLGSQDIIFASNPSTSVNYLQPAIAYSTTSDRYLLVLRHDNGNVLWQTIAACDIDSDAGNHSLLFSIIEWDTPYLPEQPDVAYNHSRNEFLVTWQQIVAGDFDVYARRVKMTDGTGVLESAFAIANSLDDEIAPSVAAIPTVTDQGQYLVAWGREAGFLTRDIRGRPVAGDGTLGTSVILADTPWSEHSPAVAGCESKQQFLAVWVWVPVITPPAMMQVQARTLALDGTPLHDTTYVSGGQVFQAAVAAGPTGDFLVAFDDNEVLGTANRGIYGRVWGNRVYLPLVVRNF